MCIVSPLIVLGISIFTSKTLEFGPVSIKNPEFALKSGLASVVLIPPSALNSNVFEVKIEIPRTIDGETMHIGDWYEIRYFDRTTPSETTEKIILKGRIG